MVATASASTSTPSPTATSSTLPRGSSHLQDGLLRAMFGFKAVDKPGLSAARARGQRWRGTAQLEGRVGPPDRAAGASAPTAAATGCKVKARPGAIPQGPVAASDGAGDRRCRRRHAQGPGSRRSNDDCLVGAARGGARRGRPRRQSLSRPSPRHRFGETAGLVPQHDGQTSAPGVDARRAVRDRELFLPADVQLREIRQHRLCRASRRGAGAALAVADANSAQARRARDRRHWRCRRRDPCPPPYRRLADADAEIAARRRAHPDQRQDQRQIVDSRRPRHRPVRGFAVGPDAPISDPRPGTGRCDFGLASGAGCRGPRQPCRR